MIGFIMLSSELLTLNRLGYFANKDGWGGVFDRFHPALIRALNPKQARLFC